MGSDSAFGEPFYKDEKDREKPEDEVLRIIVNRRGRCNTINCDECPFHEGWKCATWDDAALFKHAKAILKKKYKIDYDNPIGMS